jgi:hypothetical protein
MSLQAVIGLALRASIQLTVFGFGLEASRTDLLSFPLYYYDGSTDSKDISRFLNPYNCAVLNTIIP